ncbi:MAG TPA: glycosyltransferase, partial [Ideonella sp.]|nr:glycosyltransferase [Ideonella sp.]
QAPVALYVGRLAAEKSVALALAAFDALAPLLPGARMVVVGDGPLRARLEAAYPHVRFVGVQRGAALAEHYASADLFLFPSRSETFGNVTLEALASGLVVVAYDQAGAAEHVRDGENGVLAWGDADRDFVDAACRAATCLTEWPRWRVQARREALLARWDAVLHRFALRLRHHAQADRASRPRDVALA